MTLLDKLRAIAASQPTTLALMDAHRDLDWAQMIGAVDLLASRLSPFRGRVVALHADNGIDWVITDLACQQAGVVLLPLPDFFSVAQWRHAVRSTGAAALLCDRNSRAVSVLHAIACDEPLSEDLTLHRLAAAEAASLPAGTAKITFTSGSTGQPKGVCLSPDNQLAVAQALLERTGLQQIHHLCVLPLSTLLENIAGIYAPLLSGGMVSVLPSAELGFDGGGQFNSDILLSLIAREQPQSLILLPELLLALMAAVDRGWQVPSSLRFIAVGGSRVSAALLQRAISDGLPVYQGYGLSECSSVVSLNTADQQQAGSVGKPLPHIDVGIVDGEIVVSGNAFLGYVGEPASWGGQRVNTGDLGHLDSDGFLYIEGRRKNLLITSFGRNISPEWLESELLANPMLRHCVVLGDARPFCSALIAPRSEAIPDAFIDNWVQRVNAGLPDYARIRRWQRFVHPPGTENGTLTANGRPVRARIEALYHRQISELYKEQA